MRGDPCAIKELDTLSLGLSAPLVHPFPSLASGKVNEQTSVTVAWCGDRARGVLEETG